MKFMVTIAALVLVAGVAAVPLTMDKRQSSSTSNELLQGSCKQVIFIWARGSTERGNMGSIIGPQVCRALKSAVGNGNVACQGVGGKYTASMMDNGQERFTSQVAIDEATKLFQQAVQKCPQAKITFGGYSQGGAVMHGALMTVPLNVKTHIVGGALFGDSMNGRHSNQIPNYPKDRIIEVCHNGDGICAPKVSGIKASHLSYGTDSSARNAASFLAKMVKGGGSPITLGPTKETTKSWEARAGGKSGRKGGGKRF